jgi:hypothetical protein
MAQPLVIGGVFNQDRYPGGAVPPPASFISTTPPVIEKDTIIIAVSSPNVQKGHPKWDGWFLSDFYAFNYLLKGLGSSQVWLTAAVRLSQVHTLTDSLTRRRIHANSLRLIRTCSSTCMEIRTRNERSF